jgi:hypothetical protein
MLGAVRIARAVMPLVLLAARPVAAADSSDSTASEASHPLAAPSSFELRRVPRSQFPLARPLLLAPRSSMATPPLSLGARGNARGNPWEKLLPWDRANGELSSELNRPRGGRATSRGRLQADLVDYLPTGKLELQGELMSQDGRHHLLRRRLGFTTRAGWQVQAGDAGLPPGSPGASGTVARGLLLERRRGGDENSRVWRAGGLLGRLPLSYAAFESGAFPRSVGAGFWRVERPRRAHLQGLIYGLTGSGPGGTGTSDGFRRAQGAGLSFGVPVVYGRRVDLLGNVFATQTDSTSGSGAHGLAGNLSGQGEFRRLSASAHLQAARGRPGELGYLGVLQPVPGLTQDANVTFRAPDGVALTGWAGRWMNPVFLDRGGTGTGLTEYPARGDQIGGRVAWRIARSGTGFSASRELRHREGSQFREVVMTSGASVSQQLGGNRSSTLEWNRIEYRSRGSQDYLSGNLNLRLGQSTMLSLQQRVSWQEPFGARLESFVDISGLRIPRPLVTLSGQLGVTRDGAGPDVLRQAQTIGRIEAVLQPSQRLVLVARYGLNTSPAGHVHTVALSLAHSTSRANPTALPRVDPTAPERLILRGRVFEDRDRDGRWQQGEPGIAGVEISVDGNARQPLVTDADGVFRAFVLAGKHVLRILPASVPTEFSIDGIEPHEVDVPRDDLYELAIPLLRSIGSITGRVVDDRDSSGVAGVEVLINGRDFTYTDNEGGFRFGPLPTGEYELRLKLESLPFGYRVEQEVLKVRLIEAGGLSTTVLFHVSRPVQQVKF